MPIVSDMREIQQKKYEEVLKELEEIRVKLLEEKDLPLNKRPKIEINVPVELIYPYPIPGFERKHSKEFIEKLKKPITDGTGLLYKPICTMNFETIMTIIPHVEQQSITNIILYCVCGNARFQAIKELGYCNIDIEIQYLTKDEACQMRFTENDVKEEEDDMSISDLFIGWMNSSNITETQLAAKFGKTQSWVAHSATLVSFLSVYSKLR